MGKLELKHILSYLDSKLKAVDNQAEPDDNIIEIIGFSNTDGNIEVFDQHGNYDIKLSDIKPILRPLSDLTKEIEVNGEKFVPIEWLTQHYNTEIGCVEKISFHDVDGFTLYGTLTDDSYEVSMPYSFYEKIFQWHFDLFGLIEKGLAIDVNTI